MLADENERSLITSFCSSIFSSYVLFSHFRPCDVTLENSFFQMSSYARVYVGIIYEKTKGEFPWEHSWTSHGQKWENKTYKVKRAIVHCSVVICVSRDWLPPIQSKILYTPCEMLAKVWLQVFTNWTCLECAYIFTVTRANTEIFSDLSCRIVTFPPDKVIHP